MRKQEWISPNHTIGSTTWRFVSWSDGGAQTQSHDPATDTTYTATFRKLGKKD